jgi:hypothetical protein
LAWYVRESQDALPVRLTMKVTVAGAVARTISRPGIGDETSGDWRFVARRRFAMNSFSNG